MLDFSIITVTYNAGEKIKDCLTSVQNNRLPNTQHIVIDNLSTDNTLAIVRAFGEVSVIAEKDTGIYNAMNKGIQHTDKPLIACLNADDAYFPGTLAAVREVFSTNSASDIVFGNIIVDGREIKPPRGIDSFGRARIFHPATFIKRSLFTRIGQFDETFRICADLDFFLRAKEAGAVFTYLDRPLTVFARGGISTTARRQTAVEVRKVLCKHHYSKMFAWALYLAMRFRAHLAIIVNVFKKSKITFYCLFCATSIRS